MENKYLRDIKDLNDSFDEYKKQVEKHIGQLSKEKANLLKTNEDNESLIQKLKLSVRNNTNHHEQNSKRLREKLARTENELVQKKDEFNKISSKHQKLRT